MIALMLLAGIAAWVVVVIVLTVWIPRVLPPGWWRAIARLVLFPVLLVLPIADEWIGRRQFAEICKREAVMELSPDWASVKRAREMRTELHPKSIVPMQGGRYDYYDIDTGKLFLSYSLLNRRGGVLLRSISWNSGDKDYCEPNNFHEIYRMVNLSELLKKGK